MRLLAAAAAAAARHVVQPALAKGTVPADGARLARVLAENAVDRRPQPPEGSYLVDLLGAVLGRIFRALAPSLSAVPGWVVRLFTYMVLALAVGLAATASWRAWRGRRAAAPAGREIALSSATAGGEAAWDAAAWRRQRDLAFAQGELALALRATWWWLARALAGTRAEPNWTGRDLLAAARRDDLRPLVARLEALAYGPGRAGGEGAALRALEQLAGRLEEVLA